MSIIKYDLRNLPSQSLTINVSGSRYDFVFKFIGDNVDNIKMIYDLAINDAVVLTSFPLQPFIPLIPFRYLSSGGNFFLYSNSLDSVADYRLFGDSMFLSWVSGDA